MPGETEIWLSAPPFHAVDRENLEWFDQFRKPGLIDFPKAAPTVIDFTCEPAQVKALKITTYRNPQAGRATLPQGANFCLEGHWVTLASSVQEFVEMIGL